MKFLIGFAILLASTVAFAQEGEDSQLALRNEMMDQISSDYRVVYNNTPSRFSLSLSGNMAQFTLRGKSLMGNTVEIAAGYALRPGFRINLAIDQAVSSTGGLSVMYTGIRSFASYALLGSYYRDSSSLTINGRQSMSMTGRDGPTAGIDFGIDQYIFNGTTSVTPATGLSGGAKYEFDLWKLRAIIQARYGMLVISNNNGSIMSGGAGILYKF